MDDGRPECEGDGCGTFRQVVWCPAWDAYYCPDCRERRGKDTLKPTGIVAHLTADSEAEAVPSWLGPIP